MRKSVLITALSVLVACFALAGQASAAPSGDRSAVAEATAGSPATATGGSVGTQDFFTCPYTPVWVQSRYEAPSWIVLERCWSTTRGAYMYRGNIYNAVIGDQLRVAYVPVTNGNFVANSYREAPADRDSSGNMPGEWYLSGGTDGSDLQACLSSPLLPDPYYCTWP